MALRILSFILTLLVLGGIGGGWLGWPGALAGVVLVVVLAVLPAVASRNLIQDLIFVLTMLTLAQLWNVLAGWGGAVKALREAGLPSRRVEAWHYTDLRVLLDRAMQAGAPAGSDIESILAPLLPHSVVVEAGSAETISREGLSVAPSARIPEWNRALNHLDRPHDTIRVLNAALGATGTQVDIAAGANLTDAIELRAAPGAAGAQAFARVTVGKGARATFVERVSPSGPGSLSTLVGEVDLGDDADILWIVDQEKGSSETHLGQLTVRLGANSRLRMFVLNAGGALVR